MSVLVKEVMFQIALQIVAAFVNLAGVYCFALGVTFMKLDILQLHFLGPYLTTWYFDRLFLLGGFSGVTQQPSSCKHVAFGRCGCNIWIQISLAS